MANNGIKPVWHIAAYRFSTTSGRTQVAEREYVVAVAKTYRQTDSTAIILGYRRLSLANNPPILYPCQTPRTCITMETGIAIFIAVMAIVVALPDSSLAIPTDCGIKWKHLNEARRRLDPVVTKVDKRS
ncbi:hypothetical protein H2202_003505 [Exophiala xenobiotica]|nr:hypothetical protein H2202_003505 [Exophiala xenobiotica]